MKNLTSLILLSSLIGPVSAIAAEPAIREGQTIECKQTGKSKDPWTFKAKFESNVPASDGVLSALVLYDVAPGSEAAEAAYITLDESSGALMIRATQLNGDDPRDIVWTMQLDTNTKDLAHGTSSYRWQKNARKSYEMTCTLK